MAKPIITDFINPEPSPSFFQTIKNIIKQFSNPKMNSFSIWD